MENPYDDSKRRGSVNSLDHFRYIVDLEAERLVGLASRTGETFVRKALADAIDRLNGRLRELGGVPITVSRPPASVRRPSLSVAIAALRPIETRTEPMRIEQYGRASHAHARVSEDTYSNDAMGELVAVVASGLGVNPENVMQQNREQRASYARQMSMYLAYTVFGVSSTRIARYFGKRDHTTVLYGRDRIQADVDSGKIDAIVWAELVDRVRDIGRKHGLVRSKAGRAPNAVPALMAVPA